MPANLDKMAAAIAAGGVEIIGEDEVSAKGGIGVRIAKRQKAKGRGK